MHQINEFAQSIAQTKHERQDKKITVTVTCIVVVICICIFKHAMGT